MDYYCLKKCLWIIQIYMRVLKLFSIRSPLVLRNDVTTQHLCRKLQHNLHGCLSSTSLPFMITGELMDGIAPVAGFNCCGEKMTRDRPRYVLLRKYIHCLFKPRAGGSEKPFTRTSLMLERLDHPPHPACPPHPSMQTAVFLCMHLMFASYIVLC